MEVTSYGPYLQSLSDEAANRVISSLNRTERGSSTDYVTPLIGREIDPDEGRVRLIHEYYPQVVSQFEWLNQAEEDQSERIGSASILLPYADRREKVHSYFHEPFHHIDELAFSEALVRLRNSLKIKRLHAVSLFEAYKQSPHGTNQGAPFFSNEPQYRLESYWLAERVARRGWKWDIDPCMLYSRTSQRGIGKDPSQRVVWGYPHYLTYIGLTIQIAILEYLKEDHSYCAWVGPDWVDEVITQVINEASYPILSIDFSSFDAHLIARIVHAVFDVLRDIFVATEVSKLDFIEHTMLNIPLLTPEGILMGTHGMPSGDALTNLVDTLSQKLIIMYAAIRCGYRIRDHIAQGDDGVVSFDTPWELEPFVEAVKELGQEVSADKGGISLTEVTFMQNHHSSSYAIRGVYRHVYPLMRALGKSMSYESLSTDWNGYDDTIRWWQIFETSKFHPHFHSAAEFLYRHDRYSRTMSASDVLAEAEGLEAIKAALKQEGFPYGKEPLEGLTNFRIVRELTQLRARGQK